MKLRVFSGSFVIIFLVQMTYLELMKLVYMKVNGMKTFTQFPVKFWTRYVHCFFLRFGLTFRVFFSIYMIC